MIDKNKRNIDIPKTSKFPIKIWKFLIKLRLIYQCSFETCLFSVRYTNISFACKSS